MRREQLGWRHSAAILGIALALGGALAACSSPAQPAPSAAGSTPGSASTVATESVPAAARSVTIGKSSESVAGCAHHSGGDCPKITIATTGFTGTYSCEFFRTDEKEPWFSSLQFTGDRSGTANAWFGYDATIYVTCDGVESNHVPW